MIRDIRRLISFMDVLYYAGDMLYKRSLRYTGLTAAVSLLGYLGGLLPGVETYSARVALVLPLAVGSACLVGGLVLRSIPGLLAAHAATVAQAQDLDLMEDYRKWREEEHLASLWEWVYRYEWALGTGASKVRNHRFEAPEAICCQEFPGCDAVERGRREFLVRARFGLARPQPQTRQRYHLGIDLRFMEDWYNGGFFDRQDVKLMEQFDGSATLEAIKREVGYGRLAALRDWPLKLHQKFWFLMITRSIAIQIGDTIDWLNRQYDTDYFNAQVLLWPGEDEEPWLEQFPAAVGELRQRRRLILDRVFGEDDASARRMLERMVGLNFWLATKLRARYDPEYLDGTLGYDAVSDLAEAGIAPKRIEPCRALAEEAKQQGTALRQGLAELRPELLAEGAGEALRAVRIAAHVSRRRLRRCLRRGLQDPVARRRFSDRVLPIVLAAVEAKEKYSARLVGLRTHHELTRLHRLEYHRLLDLLRGERGSQAADHQITTDTAPHETDRPANA